MIAVKKIVAISFLVLGLCISIYGLTSAKTASAHTHSNDVVSVVFKAPNLLAGGYVMDMIDDDLSENQHLFITSTFPGNFSTLFYPVNCKGNSPISPTFNKTKFALSEASYLMNFRI